MAVIWRGKEVEAEIHRRSVHNVAAMGAILLDMVREEAPVDTGDLAASGILVIDSDDVTATVTYGLGLRTNYAYFQEFGPANGIAGGPPRPYFRPALAALHTDARRLMGGS